MEERIQEMRTTRENVRKRKRTAAVGEAEGKSEQITTECAFYVVMNYRTMS